ncbi:MAG: CAP domain-containing protein [Myxococcota bacterium]|nr:CAP domain-containing protein [Myxococcota bacterium]
MLSKGMPLLRAACCAIALGGCVLRGDAPVRSSSAPPVGAQLRFDSEGLAVANGKSTSAAAPRRLLTLGEARSYMLELVNRDRRSMGLPPVAFDDGPATTAGQSHAEDMAKNGYLAHWGTDGSVPEQRFTEAGGNDMVMENASCFTDEKSRTIDPVARIDAKNIEQTEDMFFHEQPPHDGHRKNILVPWHRRLGIGVAQPVATTHEIPVPCIAQEFVDAFGTYSGLPRVAHVGAVLRIEGAVSPPAKFAGIGVARIELPKPLAVSELNRRHSYPIPKPYRMYWPPGYQTPIPVKIAGGRFSLELALSDGGQQGLYEVSVWASVPGTEDLVMVSLRTMRAL